MRNTKLITNLLYTKKNIYYTKNSYMHKIWHISTFIIIVISICLLLYKYFANETMQSMMIFTTGIIMLSAVSLSCFIIYKKIYKELITNGTGKIISNRTLKTYLNYSVAVDIISILLAFLSLLAFWFLFNTDNTGNFKLIILNIVLLYYIVLSILLLWFNMIVIFKANTFISGKYEINYKDITLIQEYKRYKSFPEDFVYFKLFRDDKLIGIDVMVETDFEYLCKIIKSSDK